MKVHYGETPLGCASVLHTVGGTVTRKSVTWKPAANGMGRWDAWPHEPARK